MSLEMMLENGDVRNVGNVCWQSSKLEQYMKMCP